jgi:putative protease
MKPELLAPAGSLEKVKWAVAYGADAVYFGTEFGSLRSFAGNLSLDESAEALAHLHKHGRKGYVTLNIYPFSAEYEKLAAIARTLDDMQADAFIVSDLGVLHELKKLDLKAVLHISTQANTTSWQTALACKELGAQRVNLARELSAQQITEIARQTEGQIDIEVFIHGSVCFSYSGRCAISDYLTGFRANHGECKHPCRWRYSLMEETRPGEYMPVFEDDRGLYLFNSKDLALFEYVPALAAAGVRSFKIEGRMKSIHYIASVVSFYRQVIDGGQFTEQQAMELLGRIPNRGYSTGFMRGAITPDDYSSDKSLSRAQALFVGNVLPEKDGGKTVVEVRNKIHRADSLETLSPDGTVTTITLGDMLTTKDGQKVESVNNSQFILLDDNLPAYSILRRVRRTNSI